MKTKIILSLLSLALGVTFSLLPMHLSAQGTTFTYQGRLDSGGAPYTGDVGFQATLWDAATAGNQVAANTPVSVIVSVTNGLFTLPLDFGANFPGANRWLQLEVTTGSDPFTPLMPRQSIQSTPYALTAGNLSGVLPTTSLAGTYGNAVTFDNTGNTFKGDGSGLTGVDAASVGGVSATDLWKLSGNSGVGAGQFLGTTDNQPLEFRVNGVRALRLEPGADGPPNVIGGAANNTTSETLGSVIGGGWNNQIQAAANYAIIGGGYANAIQTNAELVTIGGGMGNKIQTKASLSTISGGFLNTIQTKAELVTIGGGLLNTVENNSAGAVIGGGASNLIRSNATYATIGGGIGNEIQANADVATIGGGVRNLVSRDAYQATIGGGAWNWIETTAKNATIGGGYRNTIQPNAFFATIGGGNENEIQPGATYATIPGGRSNEATASDTFAAGRNAKAKHQGSFVWADSQNVSFASTIHNEFNIRALNGVRIETEKGIHLDALNAPLIVRDMDVFAANAGGGKAGLGRWGLFKESTYLAVGIPADDVPGRFF